MRLSETELGKTCPDKTAWEERLDRAIARLRRWRTIDLMACWQASAPRGGKVAEFVAERQLLLWPGKRQLQVLEQDWKVPRTVAGLPIDGTVLRLRLGWWAEWAQVRIDGDLAYEGDLFDRDCRLPLTFEAVAGQSFHLELRLESPKHDDGALQTSEIVLEYPHRACDPGRLGEVLQVVRVVGGESVHRAIAWEPWLDDLDAVLATKVDLEDGKPGVANETDVWQRLKQLRDRLLPLSELLKQRRVHLLGNAHIDVAWLWPIAETQDVVRRTFESVLSLHDRFPRMTFNQSTALGYWWMEQHRPQMFAKIREAVRQGWWELTGGMWVEPDCNLPSGESLVRQILHGKQYLSQHFGRDIRVAWNPDSFGFCAQLPQLLIKSGFEVFMTQKLAWNDTNAFPYQVFWWEGIDGSRILTYFTNELGQGIEAAAIAKSVAGYEADCQLQESLWLYGVGDHGGGPTADMLNVARSWAKEELFFSLEPSTSDRFLDRLQASVPQLELPVWRGELYLELHRGTYTAKADRKRNNRQLEILLRNIEILRTAAAVAGRLAYPEESLWTAWQLLLVNQFHDILPGTAVPEVFADADAADAEIRRVCDRLLEELLEETTTVNADRDGFSVWNFTLDLEGSQLVELAANRWNLSEVTAILATDTGEALPVQRVENGVIFPVRVRGVGSRHCCFQRAQPEKGASVAAVTSIASEDLRLDCDPQQSFWQLENPSLQVRVNSETGNILQLLDKRSGLPLLSAPATLQCFADCGQYWDAWNIDPDYEAKQLETPQLVSIAVTETGPLRIAMRVVRSFRRSRIQQDYQLDGQSPALTVKTEIDWQEEHILLKAAFPLAFTAPTATYEIPFGAIERSTTRNTPQDRAKWEVPALRWADTSGSDRGLSLLNDCKYGYDATPDRLRLTLLKSPTWPDPNSDLGYHEFTYQLLPHAGNWRAANVIQQASRLNNPAIALSPLCITSAAPVPIIDATNIVLAACKPIGARPGWIVRLYEATGRETTATATFTIPTCDGAPTPITAETVSGGLSFELCDLLEHRQQALPAIIGREVILHFKPYEVLTIAVRGDRYSQAAPSPSTDI